MAEYRTIQYIDTKGVLRTKRVKVSNTALNQNKREESKIAWQNNAGKTVKSQSEALSLGNAVRTYSQKNNNEYQNIYGQNKSAAKTSKVNLSTPALKKSGYNTLLENLEKSREKKRNEGKIAWQESSNQYDNLSYNDRVRIYLENNNPFEKAKDIADTKRRYESATEKTQQNDINAAGTEINVAGRLAALYEQNPDMAGAQDAKREAEVHRKNADVIQNDINSRAQLEQQLKEKEDRQEADEKSYKASIAEVVRLADKNSGKYIKIGADNNKFSDISEEQQNYIKKNYDTGKSFKENVDASIYDVKNWNKNIGYITNNEAVLWSLMTKDQKDTYNYILGHNGERAAKDYMNQLEPALSQQYGDIADKAVDKYYKEQPLGEAQAVITKGATSFATGVQSHVKGLVNAGAQIMGEEGVGDNFMDWSYQGFSRNAEGIEKILYDLGYQSGNMLPSILAGNIAGGATGSAIMGISASGNAYNQALSEGYSVDDARLYGVVIGISETIMERALGGISGLAVKGGLADIIANKAVAGIGKIIQNPKANYVVSKIVGYLAGNSGEFVEEYLQECFDPIYRNIIFNEDNEINFFTQEAFEAGFMGYLMAGVNNAVVASGNNIRVLNEAGEMRSIEGGLEGLIESGVESPRGTLSSKMAHYLQQKIQNGEKVSDFEVSMLIEGNKQAIADEEIISEYIKGKQEFKNISREGQTALLNPDNIEVNNIRYGIKIPENATPKQIAEYLKELNSENEIRYTKTDLSKNVARYYKDVEKVTGKKIYVKSMGENIEGYIDGDRIILNSNMAETVQQANWVLAHELTHSAENTQTYGELENMALESIDDIDAKVKAKQELYERNGHPITREEVLQELVAEYAQKTIFADTDGITEIIRRNGNVAQRIYQFIVDKINYFKSLKNMTAAERKQYAELKAVQKIWERAMLEGKSGQENNEGGREYAYEDMREAFAVGSLDKIAEKMGDEFPLSDIFEQTISRNTTPLNKVSVVKNGIGRNTNESFYHAGNRVFNAQYGKNVTTSIEGIGDVILNADIVSESINKARFKNEKQSVVDMIPYIKDILENSKLMGIERIAHTNSKTANKTGAVFMYKTYNVFKYDGKDFILGANIVRNPLENRGYMYRSIKITPVANTTTSGGFSSARLNSPRMPANTGVVSIDNIADLYNAVKKIPRKKGGLNYTAQEKADYLFDYEYVQKRGKYTRNFSIKEPILEKIKNKSSFGKSGHQLPMFSETAHDISLTQGKNDVNNNIRSNNEKDTRKFSINSKFESEYNNWAENAVDKRKTGNHFVLGTTSQALKSIGIKDMSIIVDQSKIIKILNKHSEITDDIVKQMPQLLEYPILVMESKTDKNSVTVLGEVYGTNGVPVMAALRFKNVGARNNLEDYSVVTSAYTKANGTSVSKTQNLIDSSKLLYIEPNKNRTDNWLATLGLQLPVHITTYGSIGRISYIDSAVNNVRKNDRQYSITDTETGSDKITRILSGKNGEKAVEYFKSRANRAQKELLNFMPQAKSGGTTLLREFTADVLESDMAAYKEVAALWIRYEERTKEAGKTIAKINSNHILSENEKKVAEDVSRGAEAELSQYGSHAETIEEYAKALKQERYIEEKTERIFKKAFDEQRSRAQDVFEELYDNAFMEDTPEQIQIKEDIIKRLRSKMYVAPHVKAEFGDDYHPRMHGFNLTGNVNFNTQGNSVDEHYEDISDVYPQYFPKDIINPADRLKKMMDVKDALETPNLLKDVYGDEYKRAAQEEFANMLGNIKKAAQRAMSINELLIPQNIKNSEYYKEPAVKYLENTINYDALTSLEIKAKKQAATSVLKSLEKMYGSFTENEKSYAIKIAEGRMGADNLPDGIDRGAVLSYAEAYRIRFASEMAETKRKYLTDRALRKLKDLKKISREKGVSEADKDEIMKILERYDYVSASMSKKGELDTRRLAEEYRSILDEHPNAAITKGVEDKLSRLDKIRVSEMTADELYDLIQDISAMEYSVRHMNDVLGSERQERISQKATEAVEAVENSTGFKETTNAFVKYVRNKAKIDWIRPQSFFEQITGYEAVGRELYDMLSEGTVKKAKFKNEALSLFGEFNGQNRAFIEKMSGKNAEWITIDVGGKQYEITPAMRISLYLHSKNEGNLRHFSEAVSEVKGNDGKIHLEMRMGQGITIPNKKYYEKGMKSEAYIYGNTVKITRDELKAILDSMTETEKEFGDIAHKYFNEISKNAINETSNLLEGISTAEVENYFPLQSDPNKLRQGMDVKAQAEALANIDVTSKGFLKERKNARNAIILDDVTSILLNQIEAVSDYYGYAVAHRNFEAILSEPVIRDGEKGYSDTLEEMITKQYGREAMDYIKKMLEDNIGINKPERSFWGALQGRFASAVLGFNPSVVIKQLSAYPAAGAVIGQKNLIKGVTRDTTLTPAQVRALDETIGRYTPMLGIRKEGTGVQEIGDVLKNNPAWAQKAPILMQLSGIVDTAVIRKLWGACECYVEDTLGVYKDEALQNTNANDINELNIKSEVTENGQTATETTSGISGLEEGVYREIRQRTGLERFTRNEILRGRNTIQRSKIYFKDFKRAAEGTKIVDKNGDPKIIFHGTNYDFESFTNDTIGRNFGNNSGIFFTDNVNIADLYSNLSKGDGEKGIIPVAVRITNPLTIDAKNIEWYEQDCLREIIDTANTIYGKSNWQQLISEYLETRIQNKSIINQLLNAYKNGKIDGIQINNVKWDSEKGKKNTQYIVFDAGQIIPAAAEYWGAKKYVSEDEYYKEVAKVFNECIFATQQNYTPMQRSQILRRTDPMSKLLTLFSSQNNQNYNILYEAFGRYKAYERKYGKDSEEFMQAKQQLGRAATSYILQNITFAGLGVLIKATIKGGFDDDDEGVQYFLSQLMGAFAGTVYFGNEIYDLIMSGINGREWEGINIAVFGMIQDLGNNISQLIQAIANISNTGTSNNNVLQSIRAVSKIVAQTFGVPAENAESYIKDIIGRVTETASGGKFSFEKWYDGIFYKNGVSDIKDAKENEIQQIATDVLYNSMSSVYGKAGGDEIVRLTQIFKTDENHNISDIYLMSPPARRTYNSKDYILTGNEKDMWTAKQNGALKQLNDYVKSDEYKALTNEQKFEAVSVYVENAQKTADRWLASQHNEKQEDVYLTVNKNGSNISDYATYKGLTYDANKADDERYSEKDKKQILSEMDISEESMAGIYKSVFEPKNTKQKDSISSAMENGVSAKTYIEYEATEFAGEDKSQQKKKWILNNCKTDKEIQEMYSRFVESNGVDYYNSINYAVKQGVSAEKYVQFKMAVENAQGTKEDESTQYVYWRNGRMVTKEVYRNESGSVSEEIYDELLSGRYSDKDVEVLYSMQYGNDAKYPYVMQMGISAKEYVRYKKLLQDVEGGKGKKQRVLQMINTLNLSASEKRIVAMLCSGYALGTDDYYDVIRYINNLNISASEKYVLAEKMGLEVKNGRVYARKAS